MQNNEIPDSGAQHGERTALLTEDDKRRIVAEIELRQELSRQANPTATSSVKDASNPLLTFLNGPFVVTLLGGVIIAILGGIYQHHNAEIESNETYVRTVRDKKYELLRTFAADLDLSLRYNAWLSGNYHYLYGPGNDAYAQQVVHNYPDVYLSHLKTPQAKAYAAQIDAEFDTTVRDRLQELMDAEDKAVAAAGKVAQTSTTDQSNTGRPTDDDREATYYKSVSDAIKEPREKLFQAMEENIKNTRADSL